MDQAWMTALVSGMFSSLVVAVVMAMFNKHLQQSVDDAKEAQALKFSNMSDKFLSISDKIKNVEAKVDGLVITASATDKRVAIVVSEQRHLMDNVKQMGEEFKVILASGNFGKVIRKP